MPVSSNVRQHPMQTTPTSVRFAKSAGFVLHALSVWHGFRKPVSSCVSAFCASIGNIFRSLAIGLVRSAAALRCALQPSHSASAVRFPQRLEMLRGPAQSVRALRFALAALPPISSPSAAPRRSASIRPQALRRLPPTKYQSQLGQFVLPAGQLQCSIGPSRFHTTAENVLPNQSLNRTRCGMPPFGPPFHSGPNAVTPQRAG